MANALQTWDPVRELGHFRHDFDEMIERFAKPPWLQRFAAASNEPPIESFIDNDKLVVRAELPGVDPKDVEVTMSGNMLTIRASREERHEKKERDFLHREISYGRIERTLSLPPGITGEGVKASYRDGILELTIPIPKELSTRKVPVQADSGNRSKIVEQAHKKMGSSLSDESALTKGGRAMPHPIEPCPCGSFKLFKDCCGKAK